MFGPAGVGVAEGGTDVAVETGNCVSVGIVEGGAVTVCSGEPGTLQLVNRKMVIIEIIDFVGLIKS